MGRRANCPDKLRAILVSDKIGVSSESSKVFVTILMILLLVGFFGLFVALVFFSEGVIVRESTS